MSPKIKKIFVLTENGCHTCNKKFSELIQSNLDNDSALFIINITGSSIDNTPFELKRSNVVNETNLTDTTYAFLNETKVFFIKNKSVDTIIKIDARQLKNQFDMINARN